MKKSAALLLSLLLTCAFLLYLVLSFPRPSGGVVFRPVHAWEAAEMRIDLNRADAQQLQQIPSGGRKTCFRSPASVRRPWRRSGTSL